MADDPIRYASVTSITGLLPKDLVWWAGNAVAREAVYEKDSWKDLTDDDAYDYLKRAHQRIKDKAADLGSEVHRYVEAMNLGKPTPTWPLPVRARMTHFARFIEEFQPRVEAAECKVYHRFDGAGPRKKIKVVQRGSYAGTLDMLAEINGELAIIDIKTGKAVWPEAALQINAYAYADFLVADPFHPGAQQITPRRGKRWYEWHGPAEDEIPMPMVTAGYVLHLRDDGYDLVPVPIRDDLYEMFLSLFAVDRWERDVKKGVLGDPVTPPAIEEAA